MTFHALKTQSISLYILSIYENIERYAKLYLLIRIMATIVGSGYPISYRKGLHCVLRIQLGTYQLVKDDRLIFWKGWTSHLYKKMEVVTFYLTKPQYSYKQVSISCFVNHGPQMLTASVLIVLFDPLGHDCDLRYYIPTIFTFLGTPRIALNGQFGLFCYYSYNSGFQVPLILYKRIKFVRCSQLGSH